MRPLQGRRKNGEPLNVGASPYAIICAPYRGMCPRHVSNTSRGHVSKACVQYRQGHVFKACVQYGQGHVFKACVQYEQGHVFKAHLFARTQIPYLPHIRSCFADWKPLFCRRPALPVPLSAAKTVVPQKRSAAEGMQRPCGGYRSAVRKVCFGNAGDQLRERPGYAIAKNAAKTAG